MNTPSHLSLRWKPVATILSRGWIPYLIILALVFFGLNNMAKCAIVQQAFVKGSNTGQGKNLGPGDNFGNPVAISGDTMVVGATFEASSAKGVNPGPEAEANNSQVVAGAAYVFRRDGDGWKQEAYLKASDAFTSQRFGTAVAISGDTVAVGARGGFGPFGGRPDGAAYVFVRKGTTWTEQARLPFSVSDSEQLDLDGDSLIIGLPGENKARIFVRDGDSWKEQAVLDGSEITGGQRFGHAVAISGNTVLVGANVGGAAHVYVREGTTWTLQQSFTGFPVNFGSNLSLAGDTAVIGSFMEEKVYVFQREGTKWTKQAELQSSAGAQENSGDNFGFATGLSGDLLVVGAQLEDSSAIGVNPGAEAEADNKAGDAGAAYVFQRKEGTWIQVAYLKGSNTEAGDRFGCSVAVSRDTVLVGAQFEDSSAKAGPSANDGSDEGAVYVFTGFEAPAAKLELSTFSKLGYSAGAFRMDLQTKTGAKYDLEYSSDLKNWSVIQADISGTDLPVSFAESDAQRKQRPQGFYRARTK